MNNCISIFTGNVDAVWACIFASVLHIALASPSLWVLTTIILNPPSPYTVLPYSGCRRSQSRAQATGWLSAEVSVASARGPPVVTPNHGEIRTPDKIWIQAA